MVVIFYNFQHDVQMHILKKLTFKEYSRFSQVSRNSADVSKLLKTKLPITISMLRVASAPESPEMESEFTTCRFFDEDEFRVPPAPKPLGAYSYLGYREIMRLSIDVLKEPVRIRFQRIYFENSVTKSDCLFLISLFQRGWSADVLDITKITCSPEVFNRFIELGGWTQIGGSTYRMFECDLPYMKFPGIQKLKSITVESPLNDEDLASLKSDTLHLFGSDVTSSGVNRILKQWVAGVKKIRHWTIKGRFIYTDLINGLCPMKLRKNKKSRVVQIVEEHDVLIIEHSRRRISLRSLSDMREKGVEISEITSEIRRALPTMRGLYRPRHEIEDVVYPNSDYIYDVNDEDVEYFIEHYNDTAIDWLEDNVL